MKAISLVIGLALLALGIAGFIPALNPDGALFGAIPMTMVTSVLFIITGLAGLAIGMSSRRDIVPPQRGSGDDMRKWM